MAMSISDSPVLDSESAGTGAEPPSMESRVG